jgi:negative regulator of sigma E activity
MNRLDNDVPAPEATQSAQEALHAQLSALVDGELSRSEAAFLLRRMEHDDALKSMYVRYQAIGESLRNNAAALQNQDFSSRLMARIAAEVVPSDEPHIQVEVLNVRANQTRLRWQRARRLLGGAAIAATVAVTALMLPTSPLSRAPNAAQNTAQNTQAAQAPALNVSDAAPAAGAATPFTFPVAGVELHQVSQHSSGTLPVISLGGNSIVDPASMDEFLQMHSDLQNSYAPTSSAVYLVRQR